MIGPSCRPRGWLDVADGSDDLPKYLATHSHLGELEGDLACMAHDPCTNFDKAALDAGERPIRDFLWQVHTLKKDAEVVGQCVKLKPDLIVTELLAGQTGPSDGILAFFDVLLCGATLIVEAKQLFGRKGEVGDDKAEAGEQLTGMPFDLGNHPAGLAP